MLQTTSNAPTSATGEKGKGRSLKTQPSSIKIIPVRSIIWQTCVNLRHYQPAKIYFRATTKARRAAATTRLCSDFTPVFPQSINIKCDIVEIFDSYVISFSLSVYLCVSFHVYNFYRANCTNSNNKIYSNPKQFAPPDGAALSEATNPTSPPK